MLQHGQTQNRHATWKEPTDTEDHTVYDSTYEILRIGKSMETADWCCQGQQGRESISDCLMGMAPPFGVTMMFRNLTWVVVT